MSKKVILLKSTVRREKGVVVLPLEKWQKLEKEKYELKEVVKAVLEGELALRSGKTRSFRDFIKDKYAKDF
ncbi:MAG: hypothetical protein AAB352_00635 [Patescibacteria group bacterium]